MKAKILVVLTLTINLNVFGISTEDANKFVDQYDTMSKKVLGFINCFTKAVTGEEAIVPVGGVKNQSSQGPVSLQTCVESLGVKTSGGFGKLLTMFSNSKAIDSEDASKTLDDVLSTAKASREVAPVIQAPPPPKTEVSANELVRKPASVLPKTVEKPQPAQKPGGVKAVW